MEGERMLGSAGTNGRSQSVSSCKPDGQCRQRLMKFRGLFFLITFSLLLTIIFMAVDQFSHLPRYSANDGAAHNKQSYTQSYNHGANRGPHLGQKPHSTYGDTQPKSRKLLNQVDAILIQDSRIKILSVFEELLQTLYRWADSKNTSLLVKSSAFGGSHCVKIYAERYSSLTAYAKARDGPRHNE